MKAPLVALLPGLIALTALLAVGAEQADEALGGKPVNGLRIDLSAAKSRAGIDEVVFTTTLSNVSDDEIRIELASGEIGSTANPFETGMFVRRVQEPTSPAGLDIEWRPRWPTHGTIFGAVFPPEIRVIPPGESVAFRTTLTLQS